MRRHRSLDRLALLCGLVCAAPVQAGQGPMISRDAAGSATLRVLGNFGRQGRYAGQFHHSHSIAVDSKGNIYVAETQGKRVQRFLFKGVK